jgi:hypothetical protein
LSLPKDLKVDWISHEQDIPKLECLLNEKLIGIDSEWRIQNSWSDVTKPSLLQISGMNKAFLVDLLSLGSSHALN